MSNNKQSMKLYTEEQVKQLLFDLGDVLFNNCQNGIKEDEPKKYYERLLNDINPIELPSDEEIETEASDFGKKYRATTYEKSAYVIGAKWMRDKIQGGNK